MPAPRLLPPRVFLREVPHGVLQASWPAGKQRFLLVVGRRDAVAELDQKLVALRARPLRLPDRLPAAPAPAPVVAATTRENQNLLNVQNMHLSRHNFTGLLSG